MKSKKKRRRKIEEKTHFKITPELQEKILFIMETRPANLTQFERDLVNDRHRGLVKYGDLAVITKKQAGCIQGIYRKAKLASMKEL